MKFVILTAMITLSTVVFADDSTTLAIPSSDVRPIHNRYADSEDNRATKTVTILASPVGIDGGPGLGVNEALSVGYFLSQNSLLSIEGGHSSGSGSDWGFLDFGPSSTTNYDMTIWGVNYKRFLGNSFYIKGGVEYYSASANVFYSPGIFSNQNAGTGYVQGYAFAGDFAVGNQWQWSTFTLGCEWGGIVAPFSSYVVHDDLSSSGPNFSRDGQNDVKNRLFTSLMVEAVRLYLGVSF